MCTSCGRKKKKVLVIDDDIVNLKIFTRTLSECFEIETETTGKGGLKKVMDFSPEIVILDVMLPDLCGYEVCRIIRSMRTLNDIKIVMVSAKAITSERIEGYNCGADDYVSKPFHPDEFLAKMLAISHMVRQPAEEET